MEILITNDDSVNANGIKTLASLMANYGHITVIAPSEPQSGKGTSLGLKERQYLNKISESEDMTVYSFDGTPVDCVKFAMNFIYQEKRPDILVSGINHGSNNSVAALYSGTLGACIEGTIYNIPSIGFSLCSHDPDPDFSAARKYIPVIMDKYFKTGIAPGTYLNINFPNLRADEIKGIRTGYRGKGMWVEEFLKEQDEEGKDYYHMRGKFINLDSNPDADHNLTDNGYISVVPLSIDNTDYPELDRLGGIYNTEKID